MQNRPEQYFPKYKYKSEEQVKKPFLDIKPIAPAQPPQPSQLTLSKSPKNQLIPEKTPVSSNEYKKLEEQNNNLSKELSQAQTNMKRMSEQIKELKKNVIIVKPSLENMDLYFTLPENLFLGGNFLNTLNKYISAAANLNFLNIVGYVKSKNGTKRYIIKPSDKCAPISANCYKGKGSYNVVYDVIKFKDDNLLSGDELILKINLDENTMDKSIIFLKNFKQNAIIWSKIGRYFPEVYYYGLVRFDKINDKYNYYITKKYNTFNEIDLRGLTYFDKVKMIKQVAELIDVIVDNGKMIGDLKADNLAYDNNKNIVLIDYDSITGDLSSLIATYIPYELIGFFTGKWMINKVKNKLIDRAGFAEFIYKLFYPWKGTPVISWGDDERTYINKLNNFKGVVSSPQKEIILYLIDTMENISRSRLYLENPTGFYGKLVEAYFK